MASDPFCCVQAAAADDDAGSDDDKEDQDEDAKDDKVTAVHDGVKARQTALGTVQACLCCLVLQTPWRETLQGTRCDAASVLPGRTTACSIKGKPTFDVCTMVQWARDINCTCMHSSSGHVS
jgi:hypothetical protein